MIEARIDTPPAPAGASPRCRRHRQPAKQHGGDDGDRVGLEQVGSHAGAVADVVADVVGDHRRVARIILGMPASTLRRVGADIRALW